MPETEGTRPTWLEEWCTSQLASKQEKEVKTLATLREIQNTPSAEFRDSSPSAVPSKTKNSIHVGKSEIHSSI